MGVCVVCGRNFFFGGHGWTFFFFCHCPTFGSFCCHLLSFVVFCCCSWNQKKGRRRARCTEVINGKTKHNKPKKMITFLLKKNPRGGGRGLSFDSLTRALSLARSMEGMHLPFFCVGLNLKKLIH